MEGPIIFPYVPADITVHLGTPDSNARNVTVSFVDYIKNVASSEIYPTWDENAIIANIHAQVSFALNRIYTEYYTSRGYPFQITSSTAYDQSFQYGRNIFENVSRLVDGIFNDYIRRQGTVEPLAAKYCNGTTSTCNGLSQWGSEELARQGYDYVSILRYYYGDDIEIVRNAPVRGLRQSYPGYPLSLGDRGEYVVVIQQSLNRISRDYPSIPKVNPVDGIFGQQTESSVRKFQQIFDLAVDGVVGKSTWYKMVYLYTGITHLSELESEGQRLFGINLSFPDTISEGQSGDKVSVLQYFLSTIALFNPAVLPLSIDGIYGTRTRQSVISFQGEADLPQTGVVDDATWEAIYAAWRGIVDTAFLGNRPETIIVKTYPGVALQLGDEGPSVRDLQIYLNNIAAVDPDVLPVPVDGVFGPQTRLSVLSFQAREGLAPTGIVDRTTWGAITNSYQYILEQTNTMPRQYPGQPLAQGQQDGNAQPQSAGSDMTSA